MANRTPYTRQELEQYFERICLPKEDRNYNVADLSASQQLSYLTLLNKHQGCKVPWENLTQHYSWHRVVNVKPAHLFRKIVQQPGRGGYCMEANSFHHMVLWSLGFHVYMAGARICNRATGLFGGLTHLVNIVIIAGRKYMIDWGFGSQGPTRPIPLVHDQAMQQIDKAQMRLLHESIPQNVNPEQKVWLYQSRYHDAAKWTTYYNFLDVEFTPEDVASMNFAPWLNPRSFFTHKVVAVRFSTDREVNVGDGDDSQQQQQPGSPDAAACAGEIDGTITLYHDWLKWRRRGTVVREIRFTSEAMRVAALRRYFGITLALEDREAIAGSAAEILPAHDED